MRGRLLRAEMGRSKGRLLVVALGVVLASVSFTILAAEISQPQLVLGPLPAPAPDAVAGAAPWDVVMTSPVTAPAITAAQVALITATAEVERAVAVAVLGTVQVAVDGAAPRPVGAWERVPGQRALAWILPDAVPPDAVPPAGQAPPLDLLLVAVTAGADDADLASAVTAGSFLAPTAADRATGEVPALVATWDPAAGAAVLVAHTGGAQALVRTYTALDGTVSRAPAAAASPLTAPRSLRAVGMLDVRALSAVLGITADALGQAEELGRSVDGFVVVSTADLASFLDPAAYVDPPAAPFHEVRLQVAGARSAGVRTERARTIAEQVSQTPGLTVLVEGRPGIVAPALDVKGMVLIVAGLALTVIFVANSAAASMRSRRAEIATLVSLGWTPVRVVRMVAVETLTLALPAGLVAVAVALVAAPWTGVDLAPLQAAPALPLTVGLFLLGTVHPVWSTVHGPVVPAPRQGGVRAGRTRQARSPMSFAAGNLWRSRGRAGSGALAVAVGTGALTAVAVVSSGAVVGSVLGDGVSLRSGPLDWLAGATLVVLGCITVVDVVALDLREQRREIAVLRAVGWSPAHLVRLVLTEVVLLGASGAAVGAGASVATIALLARSVSVSALLVAVGAVLVAVLLALLAAVVPLLRLRARTARLLSDET